MTTEADVDYETNSGFFRDTKVFMPSGDRTVGQLWPVRIIEFRAPPSPDSIIESIVALVNDWFERQASGEPPLPAAVVEPAARTPSPPNETRAPRTVARTEVPAPERLPPKIMRWRLRTGLL